MKTICYFLAIALSFVLVGCGKIKLTSAFEGFSVPEIRNVAFDNISSNLSEVAPPDVIQQLEQTLAQYQPQVSILHPQQNATLEDTTVEVTLAVKDYPLFKDSRLGMGPHLNIILDNEHYAEIYALEKPIIIKDLKPGTHTLRVLAEKPWHESFKNESAYAQTTFNVLTPTTDNNPHTDVPLLTYNQPSGVYSAEPILLDFYLTGAATENWQVRVTVNEESFLIDKWQPIYLKGFQKGNNLIQLELLDNRGEVIENEFNQPIRLINYDATSSEQNTLAQLVSNKISLEAAIAIAEQNYYIQPVNEPEEAETITEDLSLEAPIEEEIEAVQDKSLVEELPIETPEKAIGEEETVTIIEEDIEEPTEASSNKETENTLAKPQKRETTTEPILETPAPETKEEEEILTQEITTETNPQSTIEPQALENKEIFAEPLIEQNSVSNTAINEETTSTQKDSSETLKGIQKIPLPEEISPVDTKDSVITAETEESDTITIEMPKPTVKLLQWWKNFVTNLQQRFNINQ